MSRPSHIQLSVTDLYALAGVDATVEPECIGKGRICRVYFRATIGLKGQRVERNAYHPMGRSRCHAQIVVAACCCRIGLPLR
jgi:hypothetical protein